MNYAISHLHQRLAEVHFRLVRRSAASSTEPERCSKELKRYQWSSISFETSSTSKENLRIWQTKATHQYNKSSLGFYRCHLPSNLGLPWKHREGPFGDCGEACKTQLNQTGPASRPKKNIKRNREKLILATDTLHHFFNLTNLFPLGIQEPIATHWKKPKCIFRRSPMTWTHSKHECHRKYLMHPKEGKYWIAKSDPMKSCWASDKRIGSRESTTAWAH